MEREGLVDQEEWRFLLTGGLGGNAPANPAPEWLSTTAWGEVSRLGELNAFREREFLSSFRSDLPAWRVFHDSSHPHEERLPGVWQTELTLMQRALCLRALRGDKLIPCVQNFVNEMLGVYYTEPPPFDLPGCYEDSTPLTPLIFILTPGSDPALALLQFAESKFSKTLENGLVKVISLGQGQGPRAEAMINDGKRLGAFVLLQNCHLATSWMPKLEYITDSLQAERFIDAEFRLWLTSYPSNDFPISILQNGVKMTNEPPQGLKANMLQCFNMTPIAQEEFFYHFDREYDGKTRSIEELKKGKGATWKRMLFSLVFFHAYIQERRAFGPIGWNIAYEFNESDLRISVRQLQMFLSEYEVVQFDALKYLTGQCNYGGRVTDDHDRRCLMTILDDFYNAEIFETDYAYSPSGDYTAPPEGDFQTYMDYLKEFPALPHPEVFGMHANADITKDKKETQELLSSMLLTQVQSGGGGGMNREKVVATLTADCIEKIPRELFDVELVEIKYPITYQESMNTVLKQELIRYNRLIEVMQS